MKNIILILIITVGCRNNAKSPTTMTPLTASEIIEKSTYRIEQTMCYDCPYITCNSTIGCFVTYVWKGTKILGSKYDHPNKITDSIKLDRINWANQMIKSDKERRDTIIYVN